MKPTSRENVADQNSNEPHFAITSEDFIDNLICTSFFDRLTIIRPLKWTGSPFVLKV